MVQQTQINLCDTPHQHKERRRRRKKKKDHLNKYRINMFGKIPDPFIIKILTKVSLEGTYLNIMKLFIANT